MRAAVIGLGLIGASLAKALKNCGYEIYGYDISEEVCRRAAEDGLISEKAEKEKLSECQLLFIALYPGDIPAMLFRTAAFLRELPCCLPLRKIWTEE